MPRGAAAWLARAGLSPARPFDADAFRIAVCDGLDGPRAALAVTVAAGLHGTSHAAVIPWFLGVLRTGGAFPAGIDDFRAADAMVLARVAGDAAERRRFLVAARRLPACDPDGTFESHLRRVPRRLLDEHPLLWRYPACLAAQFDRRVPDAADRDHLLAFVHALAEARIAAQPRRAEDRVRRSVAETFAFPVLAGLADTRGERSFRAYLPRTTGRAALTDVVAAVIGSGYHRAASAVRRVTLGRADARDPFGRILAFFNGAILHGLFEDSGIARTRTLAPREVRGRLAVLAEERPGCVRARPPVRPVAPRCRLTEDDVHRLLSAPDGGARHAARDRTVLLLLYTTALRAGAIEGMTRADVWDAAGGRLRDYWTVTEKFSARRVVRPCAELRAAMEAYLRSRGDSAPFLFARPHRPAARPALLCQHVLRAACRRAGVGPFHPHQFRALMVDLFVKYGDGNALDKAAKFLGHRSAAVTYRHYWQVDAEQLAAGIPFFAPGATAGATATDAANGRKTKTTPAPGGDRLRQPVRVRVHAAARAAGARGDARGAADPRTAGAAGVVNARAAATLRCGIGRRRGRR